MSMQISIWLFSIGEIPQQKAVSTALPRNSIFRRTGTTTKELLQPEVAKNVIDEICIRHQHTKLWYNQDSQGIARTSHWLRSPHATT